MDTTLHLVDTLKYPKLSEVTEVILSYIEKGSKGVAAEGVVNLFKEAIAISIEDLDKLGQSDVRLKSTHGFKHDEKSAAIACGFTDEVRLKAAGTHLLSLPPKDGGGVTDPVAIKLLLDDKETTDLEKAFVFQFVLLGLIEQKADPLAALLQSLPKGVEAADLSDLPAITKALESIDELDDSEANKE
jgi:hypothetical protein